MIIDKFIKALEGKNNIIISTHAYPDADGIGGQIALCLALRSLGKQVHCINELPLLGRYNYLDPNKVVFSIEDHPIKTEEIDLIIVVDTNTVERTGKFYDFSKNIEAPILYVDHHPCDQSIVDEHCIDTSAAATGQLVGEIIEGMNIEFTEQMALALYTAILIDTSSFRYPTVSANTHRLVAKLMDAGVKSPTAYNGIYGTKKIAYMHLLGKILFSSDTNEREDIAWIVIKKEDLSIFHSDVEDTHAFINNLLVLDNIKVACMFRDDGTFVKASFRSTGEYNVGDIARSLGGGGHSHSAATMIKKEDLDLDTVIENTVSAIERLIS